MCCKNILYCFGNAGLFLLIKNKINNNNGCGSYFINLNFELRLDTDAIKNLCMQISLGEKVDVSN